MSFYTSLVFENRQVMTELQIINRYPHILAVLTQAGGIAELSLAVKIKNNAVLQLPPLSSDNLLIMDMITDKSKRNDMDNINYINLPRCLTIHM